MSNCEMCNSAHMCTDCHTAFYDDSAPFEQCPAIPEPKKQQKKIHIGSGEDAYAEMNMETTL